MTKIAANLANATTKRKLIRVRRLDPPCWAQDLSGRYSDTPTALSRVDGEHFTLITARILNAVELAPAQIETRTFEAYVAIANELANARFKHPVRFWNHVPLINDPADAGRDNYMVFNAGRFRAFSDLYGGSARFDRDVATASAIGHDGRDLVVHCLATDAAGMAVNNPRQVAPYHYSQRFGPLPPCFARATQLANPARWLLVAGTASVRGEDSVHVDDLPAQCSETFTNLAALTAASIGGTLSTKPKLSTWLDAFTELRVYFPDPSDATIIQSTVEKAFPKLERLEMMKAGLCRAELLVEIEGVADLNLLLKQ